MPPATAPPAADDPRVAEVIAAHTGSDWTVAFGGFAPGFALVLVFGLVQILLDDVLVEAFHGEQLAGRHVGDFLDRGESFLHQDRRDLRVHFQLLGEQLARGLGVRRQEAPDTDRERRLIRQHAGVGRPVERS